MGVSVFSLEPPFLRLNNSVPSAASHRPFTSSVALHWPHLSTYYRTPTSLELPAQTVLVGDGSMDALRFLGTLKTGGNY